jgi:hypothetical protein
VLLKNYNSKINKAFLEADDELKVGLGVTFKPMGAEIMVKAELNFVAERVKDSAQAKVGDGKQITIPFSGGATYRPRNTPGSKVRARWYRGR